MLKLVRTDSNNPDFKKLVEKLDTYLKITDGDEHEFYNQFNSISVLKHVVVAYQNNAAVACGAFKTFNNSSVEIKRMFTLPEYRKTGIAESILTELEKWAKDLSFEYTVLETGKRQIEAVNFYKKNNYNVMPNYGQYMNKENSLCFKKLL